MEEHLWFDSQTYDNGLFEVDFFNLFLISEWFNSLDTCDDTTSNKGNSDWIKDQEPILSDSNFAW